MAAEPGAERRLKNMRILIIRLSAIGDVIMASGLIAALRSLYPDSHIAWLTESGNADLLAHHPELDQLHLWPRRQWRALRQQGNWPEFLRQSVRLIQTLRAEHYDLVLDLQGLLKSGIWAWLSGGRRRIGLGSREGSQFLMTETCDRHVDSPLIGKEYRKLAALLGASPASFQQGVYCSPTDQEAAAGLLARHDIKQDYILLAPYTTRPQKHWQAARWIELAQHLTAISHLPVLLLGGPGDQVEARAWLAQTDTALFDLTGQTPLGVAAALIAKARLLLGVDTGLTHLALVMNTPTLALFGSTCPYLDTGKPHARVLYTPLPCSPCRRHPSCDQRYDCMASHTVDTVLAEALTLLNPADQEPA